MRSIAVFVPATLLLFATNAVSATVGSTTARAHEHVLAACELVWAGAPPHEIQRCTERAMAALGEHDRLRDKELKRMILDSEQELETCKAELAELREEAASERTSLLNRPRR